MMAKYRLMRRGSMYEAQGEHVATVMAARVLLGHAVKRSAG